MTKARKELWIRKHINNVENGTLQVWSARTAKGDQWISSLNRLFSNRIFNCEFWAILDFVNLFKKALKPNKNDAFELVGFLMTKYKISLMAHKSTFCHMVLALG